MTASAASQPAPRPRRAGGIVTRAGLYRIGVLVLAVVALELVCRAGLVKATTIIPPTVMAAHLWHLMVTGAIAADLQKTAGNVATSFVVSVVLGTIGAVVIHRLPRLRRVADPFFASYYSVPFFVFYPLFIVIFGLNDWPIIMIGVLFAGMAMVINTLNGLDRVPRVYEKVARVHRLDQVRRAWLITLPAAMPHVMTGIKLAVAYSFIGVLAAEFILSNSGIGYAIAFAYDGFDNKTMYALVLLVLIVAIVLNAVLHGWEQMVLRRRMRS